MHSPYYWYTPICHATKILDSKYEKVLVDDVISQLSHLNIQQKGDLRQVLNEQKKLFDGALVGVYPHRKFHINLVPRAIPKYSRPYAIPIIHLKAFKKDKPRGALPLTMCRNIVT